MSFQSEPDNVHVAKEGPSVETMTMIVDDGVDDLTETRNKREPEFIGRTEDAKFFNESTAMTSSIFPAPEIPSPMVSFLNPPERLGGGTDEEASPNHLGRQVVRLFDSTEERPSVAPVIVEDDLDQREA